MALVGGPEGLRAGPLLVAVCGVIHVLYQDHAQPLISERLAPPVELGLPLLPDPVCCSEILGPLAGPELALGLRLHAFERR